MHHLLLTANTVLLLFLYINNLAAMYYDVILFGKLFVMFF